MYQNRFDENLTVIQVDESTKLALNVALEYERLARMRDLVRGYGLLAHEFVKGPFDYSKYQARDMSVRCYDAAVALAKESGLSYFEGVVLIRSVDGAYYPYAHGWCVGPSGELVDPTLHAHQHKCEFNYYGVRLQLGYMEDQYRKTGYYGVLDGRHDGAKEGIYYDPPSMWLQK